MHSIQDSAVVEMSAPIAKAQSHQSPHLACLHLSWLRSWSLDRRGHNRRCHLLLLWLLWPR